MTYGWIMKSQNLLVFWLLINASLSLTVSCAKVRENESKSSIKDARAKSTGAKAQSKSDGTGNGKIFVVCFFGENDLDMVAQRKCQEMYQSCRNRYGVQRCIQQINPDQQQVASIQGQGIIIVVTHTTPRSLSPDSSPNQDCQIDIWDSPVSPQDINKCQLPVVWYGCYGAGVARECKNVIPLQDTPTVLDSSDPKVSCRFKATMLCWEELNREKRQFEASSFQQCVYKKVQKLQRDKDLFCPDVQTNIMIPPPSLPVNPQRGVSPASPPRN